MTDPTYTALPHEGDRFRLVGDGWLRRRFPALAAGADRLGAPFLRTFEASLSDRACIERQYRHYVGEPLDLAALRTLSAKIQWLKLHDATPLHTRCADKIAARDYVRERLGEEPLIPEILITQDVDDIRPERILAARFVVKSNHDWGGVVICRDRDAFDWAAARHRLRAHLKRAFWRVNRELAYKDIPPGILVEDYLEGPDGGVPADYKVFCFHGRPHMVQVVAGRGERATRTVYDLDWRMLPVWRRGLPRAEEPQPRPAGLDRMIEMAAALSQPFRFCRVDLYEEGDRVYFGEITFYPEAGYRPFEPPEFELALGDLVRLD